MTWWDYVQQTAQQSNAEIARHIGVTPSTISRWSRGTLPDPEQAAALARAYSKPVLSAFVAAGFLTPEEAGELPSAPLSLAELSHDELLAEVRHRMEGGQQGWLDTGGSEDTPGSSGGGGGEPPSDGGGVPDSVVDLLQRPQGESQREWAADTKDEGSEGGNFDTDV